VTPPSHWELQPIRLPLRFVVKEDFTGGTICDSLTRRQWTVAAPFDPRVRELVHDWSPSSPELIDEMIVTALKIARDQLSVADFKLINRSVKEMRYPAKVFAPFQRFRKVAVFGTGKARVIPVVLLDQPDGIYWETWMKFLTQRLLRFGFISKEDFSFFKIAHNVQEPVREILQFYKIYHSTRWAGKKLVIRISHPLSKKRHCRS
jgi:hypothetical protein